jgi:hypothetical protein
MIYVAFPVHYLPALLSTYCCRYHSKFILLVYSSRLKLCDKDADWIQFMGTIHLTAKVNDLGIKEEQN